MEHNQEEGGFSELVGQVIPEWRKLTPQQRAELIIREFGKLESPRPELLKRYKLWLQDNAEIALGTQIVRDIFDRKFDSVFSEEEQPLKADA